MVRRAMGRWADPRSLEDAGLDRPGNRILRPAAGSVGGVLREIGTTGGVLGLRLSGLALDMAAVPEMMTVAATTAIPWRIIAVSLATTRTFVARTISVRTGVVVGGVGVAAWPGSEDTCELQKLYVATDRRGLGLGQRLLERALTFAGELLPAVLSGDAQLAGGGLRIVSVSGFEFLDGPLPGGGPFGKWTCGR